MKLFNPKQYPIYKAYKDIKNYIDFIKTIKREKSDPNSQLNKYNIKINKIYNLYFQVSLSDADSQLPENLKSMALIEKIAPINKYLDQDLDFGEYLVPEFNQFLDEKGNKSNSFGIVYYFEFNQISLKWIIKWLLIIGLIIYFYPNIINFINKWI